MSKDKISDYSATANSNTDIGGINIDEGCAPSGINDAIRTLMKQLKDFQQGTNSDPFNGPHNGTVGATTPASGAFTTLSASSTLSVTGAGTIQGLTVGRGAGAVSTNTAVGASALATSNTGPKVTAVGYQALYSYNGSVGYNTAVGTESLYANTSGYDNVAIGVRALYTNTSGIGNTACGDASLYLNTTGGQNSAYGYNSLNANTTGSYNTAIGRDCLISNTTASNNTAVGYQAGYSNTTGTNNALFGYQCGYSLTTGTFNTFIGQQAAYYVTTGSRNTVIGTYNGNQGGLDIRTANNYIVLSDGDGNPRLYWDGASTYDFRINSSTGSTYSQLSFQIGCVTKAAMWWDASNSRFYTYTGTTLGPYVAQNGTSWTNSSDERLKNITGEIQNGLAKVCTLRAAEYTWKADAEAKPQVGLIAQDVLAVLPEAVNVPEEGATEKDGSPSMMGVQYTDVIPLLVAAIKELKAEFDAYKEAHP